VKTGERPIKKYLALSLLVMYLVIALVHISYIPKVNAWGSQILSTSNLSLLNKNNSSESANAMLHKGFRSGIENKKKALIQAAKNWILVFSLVFGGITLLGLTRKPLAYLRLFCNPQPFSYLSLCSLRI
jgi:hypothetical protein